MNLSKLKKRVPNESVFRRFIRSTKPSAMLKVQALLCGLLSCFSLSPASLEFAENAEVIFSLPDSLRGKIRQNIKLV